MGTEDREAAADDVRRSDFPYALSKGPGESPYLTWLRNHSNYMATGGFLDYLRMAGALARGIVLNFLILLPFLLFLSCSIGHLYGPQLRSLPSAEDLGLADLEELGEQLQRTDDASSVYAWLAVQLSDETRAALEAEDAGPSVLRRALLKDLRDLVDDKPIGDVELLEALVAQPKRPKQDPSVYAWLADQLSDEIRAAPRDENAGRKVLRLAPLQAALRQRAAELKDEAEQGRREDQGDSPGWWGKLEGWINGRIEANPLGLALLEHWDGRLESWTGGMKKLAGISTAQRRRLNRQILEAAFPEFGTPESRKQSSEAGRLYETGVLPPMPVPFTLTGSALLLVLIWILFSPIGGVFGEIAGHGRSVGRAGRSSSVNHRDKWERRFGMALLAVIAVFVFEALPLLVDRFHQFRVGPDRNWNAIFASVAGASAVALGAAGKLLSALGGARKKLAMLLVGLLGVLLPLLVVLYVTRFLVWGKPLEPRISALLGALPVGFVVLILLGMLVGWRNGSLSSSERWRLVRLAGGVLAGTVVLAILVSLGLAAEEFREHGWNHYFFLILAAELWLFCRLVVDVNKTSMHGLYRDRLASAYLVRLDPRGEVDIEEDIKLSEIGCHEDGSTAPYHLVNVALNLQGSGDASLRDRKSDFFILSKRFVGGSRTGYCRSETLEQVHPAMSLATAMAISAAAASPNMGRGTSPAVVALMVLLNIRLGYWLPNPGVLEEELAGASLRGIEKERQATRKAPGFGFKEVFEEELVEIEKRWQNVYPEPSEGQRRQRELYRTSSRPTAIPTTEHGLVGIGFSGGGIRSATINLGIAQAFHQRGAFDHLDYLSTVSGGGYLGASISTLMRCKTGAADEVAGKSGLRAGSRGLPSEIEGEVRVETNAAGDGVVEVTGRNAPGEVRHYRLSKFDRLVVESGDTVAAGQELIERHDSFGDRFRWRVHPWALVREMMMKLDERYRMVNLSDGGHIENLAGLELLRRRCKFIILGDGEADPELSFNGLATLIRYARIDLGVTIDIDPGAIRGERSRDAINSGTYDLSGEHCAFGTITYPPSQDDGQRQEEGYLLYLKSSLTGDEDEVIKEYRRRNPSFPHESTADQFFGEDQFECYRALGQHIAEKAIHKMLLEPASSPPVTFLPFAAGFTARALAGAGREPE